MAKVSAITSVKSITFQDIRKWFDDNMAVDKIDLNDQKVYEYVYHDARFAGIFQLTSGGAQRLFKRAKPRSILDIAILTSIYRPGPLAAKVDDLYLKAQQGEQYDWGDKRINELLKETAGLLIFQEGVMMLAEKVGGFPKDKCDEVRRAIMKRSISGGAAAKAKVDEMKSEFVKGAVNNGYSEKVASDLYEKIAYFSGYAFNASHATGYAVDSYWCAWLLTHHEEEWLTAYMEVMSSNPEDRAKAFGEVRTLGYTIAPIDVNYSTSKWSVLPGKRLIPSFLSCKGVGDSAAQEIIVNRPYKNIDDLLYNEDGSWRHSKFNKRALESLILVGGLGSLDAVGEGKQFSNYQHLHKVIIEHNAEIRKVTKKDPMMGRNRFLELVTELKDTPDWTRHQRAEHLIELFGSLDVSALLPDEMRAKLESKNIPPIDEWESKGIYWMMVKDAVAKKTKTGKQYLIVSALGPTGRVIKLFAWGWDGNTVIKPNTFYFGEVDRNDFGYATTMWKLKELNA